LKTNNINVRGLNIHVQEWGDAENPTLFMLHGWMDCGATYKYSAEYLKSKYHIVAPDLRGFGNSDHAPAYWFPDYFADLEIILNHYAPNRSVNLVGHSMGANIVVMYAGIHPQRVNRVLSLDSAGLAPSEPNEAPEKYRRWLREILSEEPSKIYPDKRMLMHSIYKGNPSLSTESIEELALMWGKPVNDDEHGAWMLKHDHKHRYTNPVRYQYEDTVEVWKQVTARVGLVMAGQSFMYERYESIDRISQVKELLSIADDDYFLIKDSGHMLHIEQPEATAECIAAFFA